jgi:hypothetical protein
MSSSSEPRSIYELMDRLDNPFQIRSLQKITHDEWADQRLYLTGYNKNDQAPYNLEGTFIVLGTLNAKGQRETYSVKFFKEGEGEKGTFWCSCPDHKFNSQKKSMVCKHICFIVCRFGQIYDLTYFNTKQLTGVNYTKIKEKAQTGIFVAVPLEAVGEASGTTTQQQRETIFTKLTKVIEADDSCPICFDEMIMSTTTMKIICCPECHNNMHKECMEVWLERNTNCVYCRSNIWCQYK